MEHAGRFCHNCRQRCIPSERPDRGRREGDELDCPLYLSHRQAGILRVTAEGRNTRFTVRAAVPPGIYRLYARGEKGELFVGVWEGGAMSRCFSREMTAPAGRIRSAEAIPVGAAGETWEPAPAERFPGWPVAGGICRRHGAGWQLALPFAEGGPFPIPALFCLARPMEVMGRRCAVFWFDGEGRPKYPPFF